jgi:phage terminase Nu1 subunit (DNA packaging protein)
MYQEWTGKSAFRKMKNIQAATIEPPVTKRKIAKTSELIPEYEESKARTEHLKAELLELERQQKEQSLVPVDEVNLKWQTIITTTRNKLLGVASKAQQRLPDLDVSAVNCIDDIVREALEELAAV